MTVKMPVIELLVTVLDWTKAVQGLSFFRKRSAAITLLHGVGGNGNQGDFGYSRHRGK